MEKSMVRRTVDRSDRNGFQGRLVGLFTLLSCSIVLPVGCELPNREAVALVQVHGRVQLDGQPVENARVLFLPLENQMDPDFALSYGVTDQAGKYELHQNGLRAGAMAGRHRVFISKPLNASSEEEEAGRSREGLDLQALFSAGSGPLSESDDAIPHHYNQSSDLVFEVIAGQGPNRADFDLKTIDPLLK